MLSDRCPVLIQPTVWPQYTNVTDTVCNVGVLWPNGWLDQYQTWHARRPRPWPYCVRWGSSFPSLKGACTCSHLPIFGPYLLWPNGWMDSDALGIGLGSGNFVLDCDPAPLLKSGAEPSIFGPSLLLANGWMDQDGTWHGGGPLSRPHCAR